MPLSGISGTLAQIDWLSVSVWLLDGCCVAGRHWLVRVCRKWAIAANGFHGGPSDRPLQPMTHNPSMGVSKAQIGALPRMHQR
jgi:hypothetical protein